MVYKIALHLNERWKLQDAVISGLYEMKGRESLMVTDANSWLLASGNIEMIFSWARSRRERYRNKDI